MKPRLLDLFCGAGGAAMGYSRAGFEVVGVDIRPQPNYPFEFWQKDALAFGEYQDWLGPIVAIHASPPCQGYTTMNNRWGSATPQLIAETRRLLEETGLPYVIENVPGAKRWMQDAFTVNGAMVGIRAMRPRLFEANWHVMLPPPNITPAETIAIYGKNDQRRLYTRADGTHLKAATLEIGSEAMGIDWMTWDELREAIPPAYTELIGHQLMQHLKARAVA